MVRPLTSPAVDVRQKFFQEDDYLHFIPKSFFDYTWLEDITERQCPILVIAEGVFVYFEEEKIREFVGQVMDHPHQEHSS